MDTTKNADFTWICISGCLKFVWCAFNCILFIRTIENVDYMERSYDRGGEMKSKIAAEEEEFEKLKKKKKKKKKSKDGVQVKCQNKCNKWHP